jgi:hypothetical protein
MRRVSVAIAVLVFLAGGVAADLTQSAPLNPFQAPPAWALGSGLAPGGAHCSAAGG